MNELQLRIFVERISATAIANQAILKCQAAGVLPTIDNAILFVGDFFDPTNPEFEGMIEQIHDAIVYVLEPPVESPSPNARSDNDALCRLC